MNFAFLPAAVLLAAGSLVAGPASITLIHGIPELNVSVSIQGVGCKLPDFRFGDVARPIPVPAGTYRVSIHPGADCTRPAIEGFANLPVTVIDDQNLSVVAHLTAAATPAPTISAFSNQVNSAAGRARVVVHHTAAAPAVDIVLTKRGGTTPSRSAAIIDFENNAGGTSAATLELKPGAYDATVYVAGTETAGLGPLPLMFEADKLYLVYAIGAVQGGSLRPAVAVFDLPVRR